MLQLILGESVCLGFFSAAIGVVLALGIFPEVTEKMQLESRDVAASCGQPHQTARQVGVQPVMTAERER